MQDRRPPKLLIVAPQIAGTFIKQDADSLQSAFEVTLYPFPGAKRTGELRQHITNTDIVLIWFAGRHAPITVWLARRFAKPIVTIVGGYEAAWIPAIGYGTRPGTWKSRLLRWVLKQSDRIVAVSTVTEEGTLRVAPDVRPRLHRIYNAVDTDRFQPATGGERGGILCVGAITESTIPVKNWEGFCTIARSMPDVPFTAIGPLDEYAQRTLVRSAPQNITWGGAVFGAPLLEAYQRASVYLQVSVHESFSLALAEAMACGCIPVTTRGGALPEVVGDAGHFIDTGNIESATTTIREALRRGAGDRDRARARIVDTFGLERRRNDLVGLLTDTLARR